MTEWLNWLGLACTEVEQCSWDSSHQRITKGLGHNDLNRWRRFSDWTPQCSDCIWPWAKTGNRCTTTYTLPSPPSPASSGRLRAGSTHCRLGHGAEEQSGKKLSVKKLCLDWLLLYLPFLDFFPTTWCLYRQAPRWRALRLSTQRSLCTRPFSDHFCLLTLIFPVFCPPFKTSVKLELRCREW